MTNAELQMVGIDEAAFNAATEEQRVEWGKANWTAFAGLCKAAQKWIIGMQGNVFGEFQCHSFSDGWTMPDACIPKVAPDYQPPVKRWWLNTNPVQIYQNHECPGQSWLEVSAEYAAYLQAKPDGEWELRKPKKGDITHDEIDGQWQTIYDFEDDGPHDRGYRWCKPRKVAGLVTYDVLVMDGEYVICYNGGHRLPLDKAANRVGFGGVQFDGQLSKDWYSETKAMIAPSGVIYGVTADTTDRRPAVPVRCRFWEVPK